MMKKNFWLCALSLIATLCLSVGTINVAYTANAEETATETPVQETTLQLLGGNETTAYNGSSKPTTWTYNAGTRSGSISHTGGDKKYWFEGVQKTDYVVTDDDQIEEYDKQTLRYTVTFSNQACLDSSKSNNGLGIVLIDDDIATNYWLLRNVTTPTYNKYFSQGKKGTFSGGGAWCGQNEAFKLTETSFTMTVEVACGQALRVWYNGTEVEDSYPTYTGTTLPKVGMHTFYWSADYTVSAELVGVKSLYVEPETTYDLFGYEKAEHTVVSDGATAETNYSYDFANKVGYIGGSASGVGVAEKERATAYFTVDAPDKVINKNEEIIDYSALKTVMVSMTFSDVISVDGTFDATNNNEFVAIRLTEPTTQQRAGFWVAPGPIFSNYGVIERSKTDSTSMFAPETSGNMRYGGSTSPWVNGAVTIALKVTVAQGETAGSIGILLNGVLQTSIAYMGEAFPEVGMYSRGVCAKVTNVSYELHGVKGVHEHTEETLAGSAATCTQDGLTEGKKCSVCEMTLVAQETIPAAHKTVKTEAVAATCMEAGNIQYWTCSGECQGVYSDEACTTLVVDTVVSAKGHDTIKTDAVEATCTADGNIEFWFCNTCSKLYSDAEYTTEITAEQAIVPATGHTEETLTAVAPTCTATGLTEGKKCTVCSETTVEQEEVAAAGHTEETLEAVAATCTATGLTEGKKCSVCGETLVAQETVSVVAHTESDWIVDTEAQVGVAGSKHKECTVCKEPLETEEIPALEDTSSDETSDTVSGNTSDEDTNSENGSSADDGIAGVGCFGTASGLGISMLLLGAGAAMLIRKRKED